MAWFFTTRHLQTLHCTSWERRHSLAIVKSSILFIRNALPLRQQKEAEFYSYSTLKTFQMLKYKNIHNIQKEFQLETTGIHKRASYVFFPVLSIPKHMLCLCYWRIHIVAISVLLERLAKVKKACYHWWNCKVCVVVINMDDFKTKFSTYNLPRARWERTRYRRVVKSPIDEKATAIALRPFTTQSPLPPPHTLTTSWWLVSMYSG